MSYDSFSPCAAADARLMERVDKQIGVIIDALDASGQGDDTVVILTSVGNPVSNVDACASL